MIGTSCLHISKILLSAIDQVFAEAGVFHVIVETLNRLLEDSRLQVCGCEAVTSICAALPGEYNDFKPMSEAFRAGVHHAAARALKRYALRVRFFHIRVGLCAQGEAERQGGN